MVNRTSRVERGCAGQWNFHDSTFDGVERDPANLVFRFSVAYIHESEGEPGVDAGLRLLQERRLHYCFFS